MSRRAVNGLLVLAIVAVVGLALVLGAQRGESGADSYAGSDSQAMDLIESAHPAYEAWFEPLFRPESSQVESGLFALQAGLGGITLGYVVGRIHERRRRRAGEPAATPSDSAVSGRSDSSADRG
ncbi:energy-coupling factor ABC transporter substrate-binding protein [Intrasporangium calvum]|uniref:energy-coupling factor ABC transporter substrate-binding protein n=1 Tax=Intrasporangium calvum TaxID=53358 RepID=UPI000DF61FAD|nr:energy-coupling factor ABC transporter substrate-binding protein [Intrasporangium calvum]AXG12568.1 energy-coupling factor ABC transporter substrate-binding protein [Intrasporangium calvum]